MFGDVKDTFEDLDFDAGHEPRLSKGARRPAKLPPAYATDDALRDARIETERQKGRMLRLKADRDEGSLVDRRAVEKAWFEAGRALRDTLLSIPKQLAPALAKESNIRDIEHMLQDALINALITVAGETEGQE